MKKLLFGILTFLGIGLSFCSAGDVCNGTRFSYTVPSDSSSPVVSSNFNTGNIYIPFTTDRGVQFFSSDGTSLFTPVQSNAIIYFYNSGDYTTNTWGNSRTIVFYSFPLDCFSSSSSSCEDKSIDVYYNNGNSTETITCDGVQAIQINGLSTITSTNTFTPYYNISYTDEDNQKLTESYSKDILYLENGQFKKTYTGNNDRILTYQGSSDSTFTGYVPVFDVSGSTQPIDTDYNMFNNFTDNSLKVLLSNIPGYIQYVFIIGIILLLLGIVKMFKRRK